MAIRRILFLAALYTVFLGVYLCVPAAASSEPKIQSPKIGVRQPLPDKVEMLMSSMTLEEKIGQLFIIAADGDLEDAVRTYHIGGVVLFSRHTETISQTMRFIEQIRQLTPIPPFIAVDQEGGRVSRLHFAVSVPDARRLGNYSEDALAGLGWLIGRELRSLGFNVNFAPVLDVDTYAENPVIGNRSFSQDPYTVARLGSAYIRGLRVAGIAAAAKHFPGHGDSSADSHYVLPVVRRSEDQIQSVEILPFRAALQTGVDVIMMAHVSYPALDPAPNRPASLSRPIISGILRNELGYQGIIITDAMNMKAITESRDPGQAAAAAFQAGADIILMPDHLPSAYSSLLFSVRNGDIPVARVDESLRRILALKLRLSDDRAQPFEARLKYALETVGSPGHQLLLTRILTGAVSFSELQQVQ